MELGICHHKPGHGRSCYGEDTGNKLLQAFAKRILESSDRLHWIKGVQTMSIASRPLMEGAPTPVKPSKNTKAVHVYCHPKLLFRTFKLFPLLCVGCNFLSGPSKGAQFKPEPSKHMIHYMS